MKKFYLVILSIVVCMFLMAQSPINKEQTFDQTQTFTKPIKEGAAKDGVWKDAFNSGMVDPGDYFTYYEDFYSTVHGISTDADLLEDYFGVLNSGTIATQDDAPGGEIWLTTVATTDAVVNLQLNGEAFRCTGNKKLWFEAGLNIEDVSETDFFIGLSVAETTILAGANDLIGFRCADDTGDIDYVIEESTNETTADTGFDLANGTAVRLGFIADCPSTNTGTVTFFVNDNPIKVSTTRLPYDQALTPTFEVRTCCTSAEKMEIDYIKIMQQR